jgi:prepilin-type N-terminal cleavage/methylation domain-containing protein
MKGRKMKTEKKKKGFTIVELLTVMSIIALLLGLLVPALNQVRRIAKDTRQKAQFHSIDVALETYVGEMEQYPDSSMRPDPNAGGVSPFTVGAQHLAEALLGRDLLGFDPWTHWNAELDESDPDIYAALAPSPKASTADEVSKSLDRRKGPFLSTENVESYQIAQLYTNTGAVYPGNLNEQGTLDNASSPAPVLTDGYRAKAVSLPNGKQIKAGSPILYYKANVLSREFYNATLPLPGGPISADMARRSIFNSMDNEELLQLGTVMNQTIKHHFDPTYVDAAATTDGRRIFYDAITNSKITTQVRPYNQTSYILISAGFDGVFGTPDDIYNFTE